MDGERDDLYVEQEEVYADDEHEEEAPRNIFATGWFRAVLVLTALAVMVVVALPYLLDWFEPAPPSVEVEGPAKQRAPSVSVPAPQPPSNAAQPRPAAAPSLPAATLKPPSVKPIAPAAPVLPPRAPAPGRLSEPVGMVKAAEPAPAQTPEPPRAASTKPSGTPADASRRHWVQLGLFKDQSNAERLAKTLRDHGFSVQVASVTRSPRDATAEETYHLVRVGAFSDQARAQVARDDLKSRGYVGFLTEGAAK